MNTLHFPLRSAFLALPLDDDNRREFQEMQRSLADFSDALCFQKPETPHLTLQYWPELLEIEYQQILRNFPSIAQRHQPFSVQIRRADTFRSRGVDKVLFLDADFSDELARLKKACPWPNVQPFHPHITLARVRHAQRFAHDRKKIFKQFHGLQMQCTFDRVRLYAIVNDSSQTPLIDFPLGQPGPPEELLPETTFWPAS